MAEEQKQDTIEKQLSVGNFAMQQARTIGLLVGGTLVGGAAFFGLAKTGLGAKLGKWLARSDLEGLTGEKLEKAIKSATIGGTHAMAGAGALGGLLVGGAASQYEHWAKVERERLGVQEINKDVADIMASRAKLEDTIEKQHSVVESLLKQHQHQGHAQKILHEREENQGSAKER